MTRTHNYRILRVYPGGLESLGDEITTKSDKEAHRIFQLVAENQKKMGLPVGHLILYKQIHQTDIHNMKSVTLSEQEWKALDQFLEELGDHQSNAGCNDLPKSLVNLWTPVEGRMIAEEFAKYNNADEPEGPTWPIPDFCLLSLIQSKIKKQVS